MADKYEDEILEGEVSDDDDQEENKKEPEKYCTLCHRAESQVGKMIDLPNNIHICPDCMQRSFDSMNQQMQTGNFNYGDLLNMPNVSMIDLSSFQNQMGQQKKPKKKKAEKKEPVLDLKKIPAPHKIKATLDEYVIGQEYANLTGLDAVHMGVELEATYRPVKSFELKGMFSLGDWKWKDDIHFTMYDEANNPIGTYDAYLKDVHVGNSAQLTSALSASWEPFKGFKISADYNFFGKNYADFDPQNRVNEADAGIDSWKLPDYGTIDLGMNYRFNITKDIRAIVYSNVYNLTNTEYIADAKDGTNHDWKTALVYYGFGTTWSAGFKVIF